MEAPALFGAGQAPKPPREKSTKALPDAPPFKVFIRNLPYKLTAADVADRMTELCGDVTDVYLLEKDGRPKGSGFVQLGSKEGLIAALALDDTVVFGNDRKITVDIANAQAKRDDGHHGGDRGPRRDVRRDDSQTNRRGADWGPRREGPGGYGDRPDRPPRRDYSDKPAEQASEPAGPPAERKKLVLQKRTKPLGEEAPATARSDIFGDAKPQDLSTYEAKKALAARESGEPTSPAAASPAAAPAPSSHAHKGAKAGGAVAAAASKPAGSGSPSFKPSSAPGTTAAVGGPSAAAAPVSPVAATGESTTKVDWRGAPGSAPSGRGRGGARGGARGGRTVGDKGASSPGEEKVVMRTARVAPPSEAPKVVERRNVNKFAALDDSEEEDDE